MYLFIHEPTHISLLCAKPHIGCWAHTDKTSPALAPWRTWSQSHTFTKALSSFLGFGRKGILQPHISRSPNLVELARTCLWKENKTDPQHGNNPSDLCVPPTQKVRFSVGPMSLGIREREHGARMVKTAVAFDLGIKNKSRLSTDSPLPSSF